MSPARTVPPPEGTIRTADACRAAGVTYRQLDHWVTRGYVHVHLGGNNTGSGNYRAFTPGEVDVIRVAGRLTQDGVPPARAFALARQLAATGVGMLGDYRVTVA